MSSSNQKKTENLSLIWTELAIMAATLACVGLFFLALHKNDFAAWIFLAILAAAGSAACVFFFLKARKDYTLAGADEKPKRTFVLSLVLTAVTVLAFLAILIITLVLFLI